MSNEDVKLNMGEDRINEILEQMPSFQKETYYNSERLDEMFRLQEEMVRLTFGEEAAKERRLKVVDVQAYLEQRNKEMEHTADHALERFTCGTKKFCTLLCSEIAGKKGEDRVYETLINRIPKENILRNVELRSGPRTTEIDFIVFTPQGITIIENKASTSDVEIDENGDYTVVGTYLRHEGNIEGILNYRKELLEEILKDNGLRNVPVNILLTFSKNKIRIHNQSAIPACFADQVVYNLPSANDPVVLNNTYMARIVEAIHDAEYRKPHPIRMDVAQYKRDFAAALAMLKETPEQVLKSEEAVGTAETMANQYCDGKRPWYKKLADDMLFIGKCFATSAAVATASIIAIDTITNGKA